MCTEDEMIRLQQRLPRFAAAIADRGYVLEQDGFLGYSAMRRCKDFLIERLSEYLHIGQDDLIYAEKHISGHGLCNIIYKKVSADDDITTAEAFIADLYGRLLPPA